MRRAVISSAVICLLTAFVAFNLGTVASQTACAAPRDGYDNLYCLMKICLGNDDDLNTTYRSLVSRFNTEGRALLKRYQLQWIDARNAECSRAEGRGFFINVRCSLEYTQQRTTFLRERLNECRSVGCINNRLR